MNVEQFMIEAINKIVGMLGVMFAIQIIKVSIRGDLKIPEAIVMLKDKSPPYFYYGITSKVIVKLTNEKTTTEVVMKKI